MTNITRRALIAAAPATALTTAGIFAAEHTDSPVMQLYREWESLVKRSHGVSDEECTRAVEEMCEIEDRMAEIPSTTVADFAAKIVAYSTWGDFGLPPKPHPIWDEAEALLGVTA